MSKFIVKSDYEPAGDQPVAIKALSDSINAGNQYRKVVTILYNFFARIKIL